MIPHRDFFLWREARWASEFIPSSPPEVCSPFDKPIPAAGASMLEHCKGINERHRAWIVRRTSLGNSGKDAWRPAKIYRAHAKKFLMDTDRQIMYGSALEGFRGLECCSDKGPWPTELVDTTV